MIQSIRYSWGTIDSFEEPQATVQMQSVEWIAPEIPAELLQAADESRILQLRGNFVGTSGDMSPPVEIEHLEIAADEGSTAVQVANRRQIDDAEANSELQRINHFCQVVHSVVARQAETYGTRRRVRHLAEFYQRLRTLTPKVFVTQAIVAVNVAVFLIMSLAGVHPLEPATADLLKWGANFGPLTMLDEWWRIFSCMFLHIGILHIAINMWVLWDAGRFVERLVGNSGFVILYVGSGLVGSLASLMWEPIRVSAGASGAVFGVFGALFAFLIRQRDRSLIEALSGLRNSVIAFLAFNLIFGLTIPQIDLSAHVGGLVAGFVLGLILSQPITPDAGKRRLSRNLMAAVAGVVLVVGPVVFLLNRHSTVELAETQFALRQKLALYSLRPTYEKHQQQPLSGEEWAEVVEQKVLPSIRNASAKLTNLEDLPEDEIARWAELRAEAKKWIAQWETVVRQLRLGEVGPFVAELKSVFERR